MREKISKNQIKEAKALHQKKYRDQHDRFLIEGVKMIGEALAEGAKLAMIAYVGEREEFPFDLSADAIRVSPAEMSRMSAMKSPPPILAICEKPPAVTVTDFDDHVFALESLADPGNLGTILRLCDWFGMSQVVCSPDCVDVFNPKVVQASMGAVFRVKVRYQPLDELLDECPDGMKLWAADMEGTPLHEADLAEKSVVLFGNEAHGLSSAIVDRVDGRVSIPRFGGGESLNVAMSAAIFAAEIRRSSNART